MIHKRLQSCQCLLVLNSPEVVPSLASYFDLVVAADGGADRVPLPRVSVVVGDMDSARHNAPIPSHVSCFQKFEQDTSDFEKALMLIEQRGLESVALSGLLGGAADHVLCNFATVLRWSDRLRMVGYHKLEGEAACEQLIWPLRAGSKEEFICKRGDKISVVSLSGARVRSLGLRWPLTEDMRLHPLAKESQSNEATSTRVELTVIEGEVLVILSL